MKTEIDTDHVESFVVSLLNFVFPYNTNQGMNQKLVPVVTEDILTFLYCNKTEINTLIKKQEYIDLFDFVKYPITELVWNDTYTEILPEYLSLFLDDHEIPDNIETLFEINQVMDEFDWFGL